ncbi:hypothetical protein KIPB_013252, partial [Kipferlia bialata]
ERERLSNLTRQHEAQVRSLSKTQEETDEELQVLRSSVSLISGNVGQVSDTINGFRSKVAGELDTARATFSRTLSDTVRSTEAMIKTTVGQGQTFCQTALTDAQTLSKEGEERRQEMDKSLQQLAINNEEIKSASIEGFSL